jgi:uncharacterized protein (TIGR02145 family)
MSKAKSILAASILLVAASLFSCGEVDMSHCGGAEYSASNEFCVEDVVYAKCNGETYNTLDSFCYKNVLYEKCNGQVVNLLDSFCYQSVLYEKCGGKIFNPLDGFCQRGAFISHKRCPDNSYGVKYDSLESFCGVDKVDAVDTVYKVYPLCDNEKYTPSNQFCDSTSGSARIYQKCKNTVGKYDIYNPLYMMCLAGILYENCDRADAGPCSYESDLRCKNRKDKKVIQPYPGMECYADGKIFGKITHNGITYNTVQIGEQVWMADNLNDYGSDKYNWAKAMNLRSECNTNPYYATTCQGALGQDIPCQKPSYPECEQISAPSERRGLCPAGWRIPNSDEWQKLINYVGGASVAGNVLAASESINGNNYGFNAKLETYWWTSEGARNTAISYFISNTSSIQSLASEKGTFEFSIRCLQNN